MPLLTPLSLKLGGTSALLFVGGFLFGSFIPMYMGVLLFTFLSLGLTLKQPYAVNIDTSISDIDVCIDQVIHFSSRIEVKKGIGLVTVVCEIPTHFKMINGSNFLSVWKGIKTQEATMNFDVQCTKRGVYRIGQTRWESRHPLFLATTMIRNEGEPMTLVVKPRSFSTRRLRDRKTLTRMPLPSEAQILIGVQTTEFKEIRDYRVGDSYRSINWKVTARLRQSASEPPLVNEFEKEGRRIVWIFLNSAPRMSQGTSVQNCFEYGLSAALELSEYYLSRQCLIGLSLFNDGFETGEEPLSYFYSRRLKNQNSANVPVSDAIMHSGFKQASSEMIFPDSGKEQYQKIIRFLIKAKVSSCKVGFEYSLSQARKHTKGSNPLYIVITVIDDRSEKLLISGIKEMSKTRTILGKLVKPVIVLHINGNKLSTIDTSVIRLRSYEINAIFNRIRGTGASVVNWNPIQENISKAISSQVRRR
jgi:uncharacterized protein (DUF58 family)